VVEPRPSIEVIPRGSATALVDGGNGLGPVVGMRAMDAAIELARRQGTGLVGVRNSNHFGPAAYYVERSLVHGCIGIAISNAPPNMAPFGGMHRFLGTNPMAIGIPAGVESPLIFDASTSVVARGKIINAAHNNQPIPEGWAIDPDGNPTTNADLALAGAVLPFGGPKGSAISFIIDIFCGVLTGAAFASHINTLEDLTTVQNVGHVFAAVRTDLFLPAGEFAARMDAILGMLKASPVAPGAGARVLIPGEIELAHEARNRERGISMTPAIVSLLTAFGAELGVPFPPALAQRQDSESARA
jgi:LDH2 family malate/lactate/ureidoglycolate dehydrogenase